MHIDISKYMSERIHNEGGLLKEAGPVITISREYGCPSKLIAMQPCGRIIPENVC